MWMKFECDISFPNSSTCLVYHFIFVQLVPKTQEWSLTWHSSLLTIFHPHPLAPPQIHFNHSPSPLFPHLEKRCFQTEPCLWYICICVCVCICIYIHTYIHVYAYIYIYIHIYTCIFFHYVTNSTHQDSFSNKMLIGQKWLPVTQPLFCKNIIATLYNTLEMFQI